MATRIATQPSARRAHVKRASHASHLSHHQRKCAICRHPDRETIEEMFVHWHSSSSIHRRFMLPDRSTIYDHAHATGLFAKRRRNLRYALEHVIERADECHISSHGVVAAIKACASLTASGEWIEPARRVIYTSISSSDASPRAAASPSPNHSPNKNAAYAYPQPKGYPSDYPPGYDPSDGWWAYSDAQARKAAALASLSSSSDGKSANHQPQSQDINPTSPANTSAPVAARAPQTTTHGSSTPTHPTTATTPGAPQQTKTAPQPANSNRYNAGLEIPPTHTKQTSAPNSGNNILDSVACLWHTSNCEDAMNKPKTLQQAIVHFSNPDNCIDFMIERRWPNGVECPTCGSKNVRFLATRRIWECKSKHPKRQFSAKVGTIFEDSALPLDKWLVAIWMIANCKNGVSSYELHRALGVTQKSAWFMLHRIRLTMQTKSLVKLGGRGSEVEVDETFIGGKARNMHPNVHRRRIVQGGPHDKTIVMGMLERGGEVRAQIIPYRRKNVVQREVRENVTAMSTLLTDRLQSYEGLIRDYAHYMIDHAERYVDGKVHTNGLENFWSLLKRGLKGTYVSVEPFHLFRYLDEQVFRYNFRATKKNPIDDGDRFEHVANHIFGKRLTYSEVTGKTTTTCSLPN